MNKSGTIFCSLIILFVWAMCINASRSQVLENHTPEKRLRGDQVKAVIVAYEALKRFPDLPVSKQKLENYSVILTEDVSTISVHFVPKVAYDSKTSVITVGGENRNGREVKYDVRRKDFKVVKRTFYM